MGSRVPKRVICLLATMVMLSGAWQNSAEAQCNSWSKSVWAPLLGCGGRWVTVWSNEEIVEKQWEGSLSTAATVGCWYHGQPTPTANCSISAGTATTIEWNISGSLTVPILQAANIMIGANVGKEITYSYGYNAGISAPGFCQTCKAYIYLRYRETDRILECNCSTPPTSSGRIRGKVTRFIGHRPNAEQGVRLLWCNCVPPCVPHCKPCNPHCPNPG